MHSIRSFGNTTVGQSTRLEIVGVVVASAIVCAVYLLAAPDWLLDKTCGDCTEGYVAVARNYLDGRGWVDNNGIFASVRAPGHSILLVAILWIADSLNIGFDVLVQLFNSIAAISASLLLLIIACQYSDHWTRVGAPILWLTCPFMLWFLNGPYPEIPFIVVFFASILAWVKLQRCEFRKKGIALVAGVLIGTIIMIRPIAIGLPIVLFVVAVLTRQPLVSKIFILSRLSIIVIGIGLVTVPWSIIVYMVTGEIIFVTDGTLVIISLYNGMIFGVNEIERKLPIEFSSNILVFMSAIQEVHNSSQNLPGLRAYGLVRTYNINQLTDVISLYLTMLWHNPVAAVEMIYIKLTRAWYGTYSHRSESLAMILMGAYIGICVIGAVIQRACQVGLKERTHLVLPIVGYFWVMTAAFEPLVRYMIPCLGLMFLFVSNISTQGRVGNLAKE